MQTSRPITSTFRLGGHHHRGSGPAATCSNTWTPPALRRAAPDAKLLVMLSDPIERYGAIFTDRLAKRAEGRAALPGQRRRPPQLRRAAGAAAPLPRRRAGPRAPVRALPP